MKRPSILLTLCLLLSACGANQATPAPTAAEFQPVSNEITQSINIPILSAVPTAVIALDLPSYDVSIDNGAPLTGGFNSNLTFPLTNEPHDITVCAPDTTYFPVTLSGAQGTLNADSALGNPQGQYCHVYNDADIFGIAKDGVVNFLDPNGKPFMTLTFDQNTSAPETQPPKDNEPKDPNDNWGDGGG